MRAHELRTSIVLTEGGNYLDAEQIDARQRDLATKVIHAALQVINQSYKKMHKEYLWHPDLLKSGKFLSGSSEHFFNPAIPSDKFATVKPKVGDIDTQVDVDKKPQVNQLLATMKGKLIKLGNSTVQLKDFKPDPDQSITLWYFTNPDLKVQIDMEFVDYEQGKPTEWSKFSHSSSWDDLTQGIKGVFHKNLIRAFTTNTLKDRLIQKKSGLKPERATDIAFAVTRGMRYKYKPVLDDTGKQRTVDGVGVYQEIPTKDSEYTKDISQMFEMIFGRPPKSTAERNLLWSFTGGLKLANQLLDDHHKRLLIDGFVYSIFGPIAQEMYKGNPDRDRQEKMAALEHMVKTLGMQAYWKQALPEVLKTQEQFYNRYRQDVTEEAKVKSSRREGIQHLEQMPDVEFIHLVRELNEKYQGSLKNAKMTLKIDGLGCRFGRDAEGHPFFESSRSGPVFVAKLFSKFAEQQGFTGEKLERAQQYDDIFDLIVGSDFIKTIPVDTKVHCELLYNPMADITEAGYKFVTVRYNPQLLGKLASIVPFYAESASTGERRSDSDSIKNKLLRQSNENIRFIDDRLKVGDLNIQAIIDPVASLDDQAIAVLQSRKGTDRAEKQQIQALVQVVKDQLAQLLLTTPEISGRESMGSEIEGLILHRSGRSPIKVTTPTFKAAIAAKQKTKRG